MSLKPVFDCILYSKSMGKNYSAGKWEAANN